MRLNFSAIAAFAALSCLSAVPASKAASLGFSCLTPNQASACGIGTSQLAVNVFAGSGAQAGRVGFTFTNAGPAASAISEIYFADGTLLAQASIVNGPGVSFVQGANPPNLPDGNLASPPFQVTQGFLAEAAAPPPANGVGPGEAVTIYYTLQGGQSFADTVNSLGNGALRIGLHVIGFSNGASASFVNTPVPLPAGLALLATSLLAGARLLRRRAAGAVAALA